MLTSTGYDMQKVTLSGVTFTDEQLEASCDELDEMKKELDENMEKILTMKEMGRDQYHRELAYLRSVPEKNNAERCVTTKDVLTNSCRSAEMFILI